MANLIKCTHYKTELHADNFSNEVKYLLRNLEMTQKELAMRLGVSVKHINSILKNTINDIPASVLEGLEYVFRLPAGLLSKVYNEYNNQRIVNTVENIDQVMNTYGLSFLIKHHELSLPFGILIDNEMEKYMRLMELKRFYGVSKLEDYHQYLMDHALAESKKYVDKKNVYIWIRFCELSIEGINNKKTLGIFRNGSFKSVITKVLTIMSEETDNFQTKIVKLKDFLGTKGIILVTRPFIEECIIRGITLKKGAKRYIFLSDMYHSEPFIFFGLLHELIHCYFPQYTEDAIDKQVMKEYFKWEHSSPTKYKAIYEAILAYEVVHSNENNGSIDLTKQQLFYLIQQKYEVVTFDDNEGEHE